MPTNVNPQHKEGKVATAIEEQTAKLPSDLFSLGIAGLYGRITHTADNGPQKESLFVGQWAAPFLLLGLYNKIVKLEGHDAESSAPDGY